MQYGTIVFKALEPTFLASCCTHYKTDFTVHDKELLRMICVPGLEFLWHVRETGTTLIVLGIGESVTYLDSALSASSKSTDLFHVRVTTATPRVRRVSSETAKSLLSVSPDISPTLRIPARFGSQATYAFMRHSKSIASAAISLNLRPGSATPMATVEAHIPDELDSLTRMRVKLLIERCVTAQAHTLFWAYDKFDINGVRQDLWLAKVTATGRPELNEPALAEMG